MADKNSSIISAAKATLVGGAIFLIPGFLAFFVLGKVFGMLRTLAVTLGPKLGITSRFGGVLLDLAAIAAILFVCFLAGLIARRAAARRMRTKLDHVLLDSFPGYAFVKNLAENMQQSEGLASSFVPVLVKSDDNWQMAFETDRTPGGIVAIYMPGAPNPWSGNVAFVRAERVQKLSISITQALKINRALGRGSELLDAELEGIQKANRTHELAAGADEAGAAQPTERRSAATT
jgi:uncharacterized membrane protein